MLFGFQLFLNCVALQLNQRKSEVFVLVSLEFKIMKCAIQVQCMSICAEIFRSTDLLMLLKIFEIYNGKIFDGKHAVYFSERTD